jgi:hypothetical protein
MTMKTMKRAMLCGVVLLLLSPAMRAQKTAWRQATDAELASLLPASGIVNRRGHFIAGVVLITAGYSANGKYSHYLIVQAPLRIGGIAFQPGEYVFGWDRSGDTALSVHFNKAATGELVGTTDAHLIAASSRVTSLHIWPPGDKALIQIGRFSIPYELGDD